MRFPLAAHPTFLHPLVFATRKFSARKLSFPEANASRNFKRSVGLLHWVPLATLWASRGRRDTIQISNVRRGPEDSPGDPRSRETRTW